MPQRLFTKHVSECVGSNVYFQSKTFLPMELFWNKDSSKMDQEKFEKWKSVQSEKDGKGPQCTIRRSNDTTT